MTRLPLLARRRLALALAFSLAIHALVLSLSFGGDGLGMPSFELPWRDRRIEAAAVQVVIVPPRSGAAEPEPADAEAAVAAEPSKPEAVRARLADATSLAPPPTPPPTLPAPQAGDAMAVEDASAELAPLAKTEPVPSLPPALSPSQSPSPAPAPAPAPPTPELAVIALEPSDRPTWVVPGPRWCRCWRRSSPSPPQVRTRTGLLSAPRGRRANKRSNRRGSNGQRRKHSVGRKS